MSSAWVLAVRQVPKNTSCSIFILYHASVKGNIFSVTNKEKSSLATLAQAEAAYNGTTACSRFWPKR
jgi:hypothetical protein